MPGFCQDGCEDGPLNDESHANLRKHSCAVNCEGSHVLDNDSKSLQDKCEYLRGNDLANCCATSANALDDISSANAECADNGGNYL